MRDPWWLSRISIWPLILAQVIISELGDQAPHMAPGWAWSLLGILSLLLPLPLPSTPYLGMCTLSLSKRTKNYNWIPWISYNNEYEISENVINLQITRISRMFYTIMLFEGIKSKCKIASSWAKHLQIEQIRHGRNTFKVKFHQVTRGRSTPCYTICYEN